MPKRDIIRLSPLATLNDRLEDGVPTWRAIQNIKEDDEQVLIWLIAQVQKKLDALNKRIDDVVKEGTKVVIASSTPIFGVIETRLGDSSMSVKGIDGKVYDAPQYNVLIGTDIEKICCRCASRAYSKESLAHCSKCSLSTCSNCYRKYDGRLKFISELTNMAVDSITAHGEIGDILQNYPCWTCRSAEENDNIVLAIVSTIKSISSLFQVE